MKSHIKKTGDKIRKVISKNGVRKIQDDVKGLYTEARNISLSEGKRLVTEAKHSWGRIKGSLI